MIYLTRFDDTSVLELDTWSPVVFVVDDDDDDDDDG